MAYSLKWDQTSERLYETGTKMGVVYPWQDGENGGYTKGTAWNGLQGVSESPEGADETALYADDIKYLSMRSAEDFKFTIEAYTYPDEFMQCDGSAVLDSELPGVNVGQQKRRLFGFSYVSSVGNDTDGNDYGEKIHLIYGATASPSQRDYKSINDSPEAITFSWECTTTPIDMPGNLKKAAQITIDTAQLLRGKSGTEKTTMKTNIEALKKVLYGDGSTSAKLPSPEEVISILKTGAVA